MNFRRPSERACKLHQSKICQKRQEQAGSLGQREHDFVRTLLPEGDVREVCVESVIAEGDLLTRECGAVMRGFVSKSLDRTFDEILFVEALSVVR